MKYLINNNIKEQIIGFDNAKLLKEKGFEVPCNTHTFISNTNKIVQETSVHCIDWGNRVLKTVQKYSAPTQQVAIDWISKNYYLHLIIIPTVTGRYAFKWVDVQLDPENVIERPPYNDVDGYDYNTVPEAKEAAIDNVLTELI